MQTLVCPPQGPPSRPIPRAPTHRGDHQGPSPPGARTRSPGALSRDANSGAWWAVPSPLPEVQPGAFPAGDTVPPPLALPPAGSPACHSAKAVGPSRASASTNWGGRAEAGTPSQPFFPGPGMKPSGGEGVWRTQSGKGRMGTEVQDQTGRLRVCFPRLGQAQRGEDKRNQPYLPVELVVCELFHTDPIHF